MRKFIIEQYKKIGHPISLHELAKLKGISINEFKEMLSTDNKINVLDLHVLSIEEAYELESYYQNILFSDEVRNFVIDHYKTRDKIKKFEQERKS